MLEYNYDFFNQKIEWDYFVAVIIKKFLCCFNYIFEEFWF